tara:strand:- start:2910 stop:3971 length:1062 start_codon:yes stop_codon:yes gene_type:complete
MHKFVYTQRDKRKAIYRAKSMGLLKNNKNGFQSVVRGMLGELMMMKFLKKIFKNDKNIDISHSDTYDFDIEIKNKKTLKTIRLEIKSSKHQSLHVNSVYAYNSKQQCDIYVFLREHMYHTPWCKANNLRCNEVLGYFTCNGAITKQRFSKQKKYIASYQAYRDKVQVKRSDCCSLQALINTVLVLTKNAETISCGATTEATGKPGKPKTYREPCGGATHVSKAFSMEGVVKETKTLVFKETKQSYQEKKEVQKKQISSKKSYGLEIFDQQQPTTSVSYYGHGYQSIDQPTHQPMQQPFYSQHLPQFNTRNNQQFEQEITVPNRLREISGSEELIYRRCYSYNILKKIFSIKNI